VLDYSFRTPSALSQDALWNNMRDKTRNLIRGAEISGIYVQQISDIDQFLNFYERSLKARGVRNVYTSQCMRRICVSAVEHQSANILGAYTTKGDLVAAILVVWDRENSYYLLSSRRSEAHSGAVSLLIWHGMQEAAACGRGFDFDGTPTPGIVRFLSGFNASLVPRIQAIRGGPIMRIAHAISRHRASRSMFGEGGSRDASFY
jgi:lipid II:glycine glycyltransferase (peptidoglycan interpeptide bridge formation enzyme)